MSNFGNIVFLKDLKTVEEIAAAWVARIDSRTLSVAEQAALDEWLGQNQKNQDAMRRMSRIWGGCDVLDDLNYLDHSVGDERQGVNSRSKTQKLLWAIAASVLLVIAIQVTGYFNQTQEDTFVTTVGEQKKIMLVDGSSVILNTNSKIEIDISREIRRINLTQGEAYFEVASDAQRPFKVYTSHGVVKAVGTAFTVFAHPKKVEVTVTEGVVELLTEALVKSEPDGSDVVLDRNSSAKKLIPVAALTVGETAVLSGNVERINKMEKESMERKLLWREGFIAFTGEPLSVVVSEISRYTDMVIEIDNNSDDLGSTPIGGYFKVGDTESLFEALENIFGVQVTKASNSEVKLSRVIL